MQPNYIVQLNQFQRWLEIHYLSGYAQLLWFKFIGLFNACGWPDRVQVDTRRLMMMVCAENKQTAYRARDAPAEAGLLGKKGDPSTYRMLWFLSENRTENVTDDVTDSVTKTTPINKYKEKRNENQTLSSNGFEDMWQVYPRKIEKAAARKAYEARLKDGWSPDELLAAAKEYAAMCLCEKREQRYIKHAAVFFGISTPFADYLPCGSPSDEEDDLKDCF